MAAEVALQQLNGIREKILTEGDSLDSWLLDAQLPSLNWQDLEFRLHWPQYVQVLELILSRRSPDWLSQRGEDSIHAPEAHLFKTGLLLGFDEPGAALEWMCGPVGPFAAVSPFLQSTLQRNDQHHYTLQSRMLRDLSPCEAFHFYSRGVLQGFPCVLAERPATVDIEHRPDGAVYQIRFAAQPLFAGLRRRWQRSYAQPNYLTGVGDTYLALVQGQIDLQAEQEKVRHAELAAARTEKQESLGFLTSGVAHDFRNLLTVIQGQLGLVQLNADAAQQARLEEALAACQQGAELTERLLAYVRRKPAAPEDVDVAEVLNSVQPILEKGLGKKGELKVSVPEVAHKVHVERGQLENALLNLVVNAGDAIDNNGVVTIRSELTNILEDSSLAADCAPGEYVKISVQDDGEGIDTKIAERVFDPYFTTKDQGTGLGLSSVWGFVKQHGGHIALAPSESQGCRFDLYLPQH